MNAPDTLRAMIARIGISQRHAARLIGISERQMRSYLAAPETATALEAPAYVGLALEGIIARLDAIDLPDALMDAISRGERVAIWLRGRWQALEPGQVPDDDPLAILPADDPSDGWKAEDRDALRDTLEGAVLEAIECLGRRC